jgi:hypothetical protein
MWNYRLTSAALWSAIAICFWLASIRKPAYRIAAVLITIATVVMFVDALSH